MKTKEISGLSKYVLVAIIITTIMLGAVFIWIEYTSPNKNLLYLYGNVDIREVQLAFRQPGRLEQVPFDEGDAVVAGMRVATLDAQPYQEALAAAEATVQVAQAELSKMRAGLRPQEVTQAQEALHEAEAVARRAERDYHRIRNLLTAKASSQQDVDSARAARDQAVANVKSARAGLSQAQEGFRKEDIAAAEASLAAALAARDQATTALADTELFTPSDGTILVRIREPGSMLSTQDAVYSLSLDKPVYVRAYISETSLGRIFPGTTVRVRSDSSEKTYHGQVGFISPRAEFTPKTVETTDLRTDLVYRLRIVVNDADLALRQGMPVTVEVDLQSAAATSLSD